MNLNKVQEEFEESKRTAEKLREEYLEKLDNLDVGHEEEIDRIKMKHKDISRELQNKMKELEIK